MSTKIFNKKFLTFLLLFSLSFFITTNVYAVTTIGLNIDTGGTLTVTGNASLGTVNGNTITTGTGILTLGASKTLTISNTLTLAGTDSSTLNIGTGGTLGTAAYTAATAYQASSASLTSLAGLTYASPSFVKMTAAGTFALDTNTYLTSLSGAVLTDQTAGQTIGLTGARLTKLWATDITLTNALVGSVTGNAGTVTNATLTTALTVNTGTVTLTGNVANTSVLTIGAGAVSVSGTNTGDNAANSSTMYIGTTAVALNRASAALVLTGITSIDGSSASTTGNAATATTATNLAGGSGGTLPYQSAAGTTALLANGAAGQVLQSNGTTLAPSWVAAPTGDMALAGIQTVTGAKTFNSGKLILAGATSGTTMFNAAAIAGTTTITMPGTTGTMALTSDITGINSGTNTGDQTITLTGGVTGSGVGSFAATVITNANLTGDVTSVGNAATVVKINGTLMSGLATGILKNTTTTGVPSIAVAGTDYSAGTNALATGILKSTTTTGALTIAVAGDFPTLNQNTTGNATTATTATHLAGGLGGQIPYQSAAGTTAMLANGTAGYILQANGTTVAPSWVAAATGTVTSASVVSANGFAGSVATATTTPAITLTTSITGLLKGNGTAISAATAGTDYSAGTNALATGILKSTTTTGALTIAVAGDFPTLNQNTTGSAATLTTARAIYGNNFDGSAALTGIIASTYGGTGNGFTKFSGPTTSERVFTLPDVAAATILTTNDLITLAQGGTGANLTASNGGILYSTASAGAILAGTATAGQILRSGASVAPTWSTATYPATAGTSGNVLTSDGTNFVSQAASSIPTIKFATTFESSTRFSSAVVGSGVNDYNSNGTRIYTGLTSTSSARSSWSIYSTNSALFDGSPVFSVHVTANALDEASGIGSSFFGIGQPTVNGSGHTFTIKHIGFKILKTGGVVSLYATQGDGTTNNVSSALTTIVTGDELDLILKVNGTTSVNYYWRKNGGALSSATNLTSNLPTGAGASSMQYSTSNNDTAFNFSFYLGGSSYER